MKYSFSIFIIIFISQIAFSQSNPEETPISNFYVESAFTFSHFEQQVKSEIGGAKGELIVDDTNLSFLFAGGARLFKAISVGAFFRYDQGTRNNSLFNGFDSNGQATIINTLGGDYSETWIGPFVKLHYKQLFFSIGYGLFGQRTDDGRPDVEASDSNLGDFSLDPSVAWVFNIGGNVPLTEKLGVYFGIEYRARYYNERGGVLLQDNIVFGTQNFTPLFGVSLGL